MLRIVRPPGQASGKKNTLTEHDSHPRCQGFTFSNGVCSLRSNVAADANGIGQFVPSATVDSGTAVFPVATTNCTLLASQVTVGVGYNMFCGNSIDGNDLYNDHADSLVSCMGKCSATFNCGAVSFEPAQNRGFRNCYLKQAPALSQPSLVPAMAQGLDTALRLGDPLAGAGSAPLSSAPAASFSVPVATPVVTQMPAASAVSSESIRLTTIVTSVVVGSNTVLATGVFTVAPEPSAAGISSGVVSEPDMRWIAGPIMGGVLVLVLVGLVWFVVRRRRSQGRRTCGLDWLPLPKKRPSGPRMEMDLSPPGSEPSVWSTAGSLSAMQDRGIRVQREILTPKYYSTTRAVRAGEFY